MMTHQPSEEHTNSRLDHPPQSSHFSLLITVLSAIFLLASIGTIVLGSFSLSPLDRVTNPERSLERLTSRAMDLEHSLTHVSRWERLLYRSLNGNENPLMEAIADYQELAEFSSDPLVDLYLAILEAEAGQREKVAGRIQSWNNPSPILPLYRDFIQSAYLLSPLSRSEAGILQARLAEEVPDNWFYSRLAIQIARKAGDSSFELLTERHLDERSYPLLRSFRLLVLFEVGGSLLGITLLLVIFRKTPWHPQGKLRIGQAILPPPWAGKDGFAVLVRGGAVTTFLLFSFSFLLLDSPGMMIVSMAILYVPVLIITYFNLIRPHNVSVSRVFGLRVVLDRMHLVLPVALALLSAGLLVDWIITLGVGTSYGLVHWTEWFDTNLVWGTSADVAVTLAAYAIIAPLFEEMIFRGVVFATLRRRFGWGTSAVLSALVFSLVHGYGLLGLLTVFWSGVLWAWAYEKTGSLWPGIIAHGINNLLVSWTLLALFR